MPTCKTRPSRYLVLAALLAPAAFAFAGSCPNPITATAYDQAISSTVASDLDPHLATPPKPNARIAFSVLVPAHCPGDVFPVIFNYAAWGTKRTKTIANSSDPANGAPVVLGDLQFLRQLPNNGYVVISADPRGLGDSVPAQGGGPQRLMDPNAEVQDARQILDWAYDHAAAYAIQTEPSTGIAKDIKVGTFGVSYGGGFQPMLAALDPRIDAIVPVATWFDIDYSLVPGGAVKSGWGGGLCAIGPLAGQVYTPYLGALCDTIGIGNPQSGSLRTEADLYNYLGVIPGVPPTPDQLKRQQQIMAKWGEASFPTGQEIVDFLVKPGAGYFQAQQNAGQPWGYGEPVARLRPVPALFIQGNSDLLFNLTEGYWNYRYFKSTGADVRLMSVNGGHNALIAFQTAACGTQSQLPAALAWFNRYLKGQASSDFNAIAPVCISVSDTVGAPTVKNIGVRLGAFPVGSLSGPGAVMGQRASADVTITESDVQPVFVSVATISGNDKVLAGVPSIGSVTVKSLRRQSGVPNAVALVATGIRRAGKVIAVDQQVTGFAEGAHTSANTHLDVDGKVLLPAVGERLQDGDEVGLLFYRENYDFNPLVSGQTPTSLLLFLEQMLGLSVLNRVLTAAGNVQGLLHINPYQATLSDIQLPILVPGTYPNSSLSQ